MSTLTVNHPFVLMLRHYIIQSPAKSCTYILDIGTYVSTYKYSHTKSSTYLIGAGTAVTSLILSRNFKPEDFLRCCNTFLPACTIVTAEEDV